MIYWRNLAYENWRFTLAATTNGLCYTGSENEGEEELRQWHARAFPHEQLEQNEEALAPYYEQFLQYFKMERQTLDFPIDCQGTAFQQSVWRALPLIPYGTTVTYSDIAQAIGKPTAVRAVASAIGANPVMVVIPCHRVIGKNGQLTGFRGGLAMKERLLNLEKHCIEVLGK